MERDDERDVKREREIDLSDRACDEPRERVFKKVCLGRCVATHAQDAFRNASRTSILVLHQAHTFGRQSILRGERSCSHLRGCFSLSFR